MAKTEAIKFFLESRSVVSEAGVSLGKGLKSLLAGIDPAEAKAISERINADLIRMLNNLDPLDLRTANQANKVHEQIGPWRTASLQKFEDLRNAGKITDDQFRAAQDLFTSNALTATVNLLGKTTAFNQHLDIAMMSGRRIDLDAIKRIHGLDAVDQNDILPTLQRAQRRIALYEGRTGDMAIESMVRAEGVLATQSEIFAEAAKRVRDKSLELSRAAGRPDTEASTFAAQARKNLYSAGRTQPEIDALLDQARTELGDVMRNNRPLGDRIADSAADRAALTAKGKPEWDAAVDRAAGKTASSGKAPSGLELPKYESGINWQTYVVKFGWQPWNPKRWFQNAQSAPTNPTPIVRNVIDFADKSMNQHGLVDAVRTLERTFDGLAARLKANPGDRTAILAETQKQMADFATAHKDALQNYGKDLDALLAHVKDESKFPTIGKNDGRKVALVHWTDSTGRVIFSHRDAMVDSIQHMRNMVTDLQKSDFGDVGARVRNLSSIGDNQALVEEISNALNVITERTKGSYQRLHPKGQSAQEAEALQRSIAEGYYNSYPRAKKGGDTNLEHTWISMVESKYLGLPKNDKGEITWGVTDREAFVDALKSMYNNGLEQEAIYSINYLKRRRGFHGDDTYPRSFGSFLNQDPRYATDPHYKVWADAMNKAGDVSTATGAKVNFWGPGREPEKFFAEHSFMLRYFRRYRGDHTLAKPGEIFIKKSLIGDPALAFAHYLTGAKGVKPRLKADGTTDTDAFFRVQRDGGSWKPGKDGAPADNSLLNNAVTRSATRLSSGGLFELSPNGYKLFGVAGPNTHMRVNGKAVKFFYAPVLVGGGLVTLGRNAFADSPEKEKENWAQLGNALLTPVRLGTGSLGYAAGGTLWGAGWLVDGATQGVTWTAGKFTGSNNVTAFPYIHQAGEAVWNSAGDLTKFADENIRFGNPLPSADGATLNPRDNKPAGSSPAATGAVAAADLTKLEEDAKKAMNFGKLDDIKTIGDARVESRGKPGEKRSMLPDIAPVPGNMDHAAKIISDFDAALKDLAAQESRITAFIEKYKGDPREKAKYDAMVKLKVQLGEAFDRFAPAETPNGTSLREKLLKSAAEIEALDEKIQKETDLKDARDLIQRQRDHLTMMKTGQLEVAATLNDVKKGLETRQAITETPEQIAARAEAKKRAAAELEKPTTIEGFRLRSEANFSIATTKKTEADRSIAEFETVGTDITKRIAKLKADGRAEDKAEITRLEDVKTKFDAELAKIKGGDDSVDKLQTQIAVAHQRIEKLKDDTATEVSLNLAKLNVTEQERLLVAMQDKHDTVKKLTAAFTGSLQGAPLVIPAPVVSPAAAAPAPAGAPAVTTGGAPAGSPAAPGNTPPAPSAPPPSPEQQAVAAIRAGVADRLTNMHKYINNTSGDDAQKGVVGFFDETFAITKAVRAWHADIQSKRGGVIPEGLAINTLMRQAEEQELKAKAALKDAQEAEQKAIQLKAQLDALAADDRAGAERIQKEINALEIIAFKNARETAKSARDVMAQMKAANPEIAEFEHDQIAQAGLDGLVTIGGGPKSLIGRAIGDGSAGNALSRGFNGLMDSGEGFLNWWNNDVARSAKRSGETGELMYMGASALGIFALIATIKNLLGSPLKSLTGFDINGGFLGTLITVGIGLFALNKTSSIGDKFDAMAQQDRDKQLRMGLAQGSGASTTTGAANDRYFTMADGRRVLMNPNAAGVPIQDQNGGVPIPNVAYSSTDRRMPGASEGSGRNMAVVPGLTGTEIVNGITDGQDARMAQFNMNRNAANKDFFLSTVNGG